MSEFKKRFQRWMNGEKVYEAGKILPEVIVTADDPIKKLVEDVNARSNADFVNRAKDPNRTWIQDWENKNKIATHKLSWAEDNGKVIVFPEVQNINGKLHDFTDPKYNHGKWDALDSAIERGDTLLMTPKQAKMYTENYKKYYPKGKTFDYGKPVEGDNVRGYDTENKIDVQKEINWMRNWLNARRDILEKNADAVGYGYSKYTPKNTTGDVREAGWNVERYGNPWNPFTYFNNSTPSRNRINKLIYSQIENAENTPKTSVGHGLSSDYNMRGVYVLPDYWDNSGNYIAFAGIPDSGVKIHELTHASHPLQQEYYILDNVFNGKVPQVVPNHKRSDLDNAKELYGALQQFRYENKLDPKYKVTQEWINKNRDLFKGTYLENIKDSDKLKLFNDVAQNNINTKRLYYANKGKSIKPLPKYDDGTDDKTYLPEYEYEATVTPQGISLLKHKRITNEEDWLKYWGNVGAGYVNKAQESAAPVVLNGMSMLTGNPLGALAGIAGGIFGEDAGYRLGYKIDPKYANIGKAVGGLIGGSASDHIINATDVFDSRLYKQALDVRHPIMIPTRSQKLLKITDPGDLSEIVDNIADAAAYKRSKEYYNLVLRFIKESGADVEPDVFFKGVKKAPQIIPENISSRYGAYKYSDNIISLNEDGVDPSVPYHEGLHWLRIGVANIDEPLEYYEWVKAVLNGAPKYIKDQLWDDYYNSTKGAKAMDAKDAIEQLYLKKVAEAIYEDTPVDSEMRKPSELLVHGLETGKRLGIQPFLEFPGYDKISEIIEKARHENSWLWDVRADGLKESKIFWDILTGNFAPAIVGVGLYSGLQEHDKGKSIRINPANKGKFNATKKRTGKTTEQLAHSKNPLTRRRAIFALNSRKFKH